MAFGRALAPAADWHASMVRGFSTWATRPNRYRMGPAPRHVAIPRGYRHLSFACVATYGLCVPVPRLSPPRMGRSCAGAWNGASRATRTGRTPTRAHCCSASCPTIRRPGGERIRLVHADAAAFLEGEPAGSFAGFARCRIFWTAQCAVRAATHLRGQTGRREGHGGSAQELSLRATTLRSRVLRATCAASPPHVRYPRDSRQHEAEPAFAFVYNALGVPIAAGCCIRSRLVAVTLIAALAMSLIRCRDQKCLEAARRGHPTGLTS